MAITQEIRIKLSIQGPNLDRNEVIVGRQGFRVGRSSENNLALNHREISRQHMRIIWREDDKYLIEDLNSSNGVVLNDTRLIPRVPAELNVGDTFRVGPYLFRFVEFVFSQVQYGIQRVRDDSLIDKNGDLSSEKRIIQHVAGIPRERSNWLQYLPEVYSNDEFLGRYLLIFETLLDPIIWMIDNFDLYLSPEVAPQAWLQWLSSWFDLLLHPDLPQERQRKILEQAGWLFLRRGTSAGLKRLLELYFGVTPEIIEDEVCHFTVRLALSESETELGREVVDRLILSQKPAFASYKLELT